jgi:hypothetical protein
VPDFPKYRWPLLVTGSTPFYLSHRNQTNPIFENQFKSSIMKRRVRKIANFFAFNLLFFALYLNFIHKDKVSAIPVASESTQQTTAAFSGTVLVENPEQYLQKKDGPASQPVTVKN